MMLLGVYLSVCGVCVVDMMMVLSGVMLCGVRCVMRVGEVLEVVWVVVEIVSV